MAFLTLGVVRTAHLNPALGLDSDTDVSFGNTATRNAALKDAFARLWPEMGRVVRENITFTSSVSEYTLTDVQKVQAIDVVDTSGNRVSEVKSWRVYEDESDDANATVVRLVLSSPQPTSVTGRAIGYRRYLVPSVNADVCDLPDALIYIVVLGAKAYLYGNMLNRHITSQRRQSENTSTAESTQELLAMFQTARADFLTARTENRRSLALPRATGLRR